MIVTRERIDQKLDRLKQRMDQTRNARWAAGATAMAGAIVLSWWRRHRRRTRARAKPVLAGVPISAGRRRL
jgi:hypothetical protein